MSYVIYNTESTYYMAGMKSGGYKSKGAATAALNRAAKMSKLKLAAAKYFDKIYAAATKDHYTKAIEATAKKFPEYNRYTVPTNTFIANRELIIKDRYVIADAADFHNNIEKMVTRVNLMSKKEYEERANTPNSCSPATETYWSM
jgi:hypothetical protein